MIHYTRVSPLSLLPPSPWDLFTRSDPEGLDSPPEQLFCLVRQTQVWSGEGVTRTTLSTCETGLGRPMPEPFLSRVHRQSTHHLLSTTADRLREGDGRGGRGGKTSSKNRTAPEGLDLPSSPVSNFGIETLTTTPRAGEIGRV